MVEASNEPDPTRYGRSFADVYDEWYDDAPTGDLVAFVGRHAAPGAAVLELGVGTGRWPSRSLTPGWSLTGLDASTDMLERLRAKPRPATGSPSSPVTPRSGVSYPAGPFDVVLAAFNLLFNITTADAQQRCLRAAAPVRAGGVVVVEAFVPSPIVDRRRDLVTKSVEHDRVVLIATDTDPAGQLVRGSHIELTESGTRLRPWTIRARGAHRDRRHGDRRGLEPAGPVEDFAMAPFVPDGSPHHVSTYRASTGTRS